MRTDKHDKLIIKLPTETIEVGPGTVPVSTASVSRTSVKEMSSGLRRISKLKIFEAATLAE